MVALQNIPAPSKEPKQRSLNYSDIYLTKYMPPWSHVGSLPANTWRAWVLNQPIAMVCRETIIAYLLSLDWKITPRDSKMYDELRPTIKYYTKLIERGGYALGTDYDGIVEWCGADLLDIPFGTAAEVGRKNDSPDGRVVWFKPLDGGTLYPTLNSDNPIIQWFGQYDPVLFPEHAITRSYMSPVPIITREGWGMAPPEKIQLALEMLIRGDRYYANLLLDVPAAGILDLGDMEQGAALEWVEAFRTFVANSTDALKIPVLYEHTSETKFLPFGKVPNDLMYDKVTMKYAAIVAAAYGMSLSDIGLQTTSASGETLAGSIRQERRTRKTGIARTKKKFKYFFQNMLPDYLQFDHIDLDDELNTAVGRARLANASAWNLLIEKGVFTRGEARLQIVQDGLVTVNVPEEPPTEPDEFLMAQNAPAGTAANRQLGNPVPASSGGMGEIKSLIQEKAKINKSNMDHIINTVVESYAASFLEYALAIGEDNLQIMASEVSDCIYQEENYMNVRDLSESISGSPMILSKKSDIELHGVKYPIGIIKDGFKLHVTRSAMKALVDTILDEDVFDGLEDLEYDSVVESVKSRLQNVDLLDGFLDTQIEKLNINLEEIDNAKTSD